MFGRPSREDRERKIWQVRVIRTDGPRDEIYAEHLTYAQAKTLGRSIVNARNIISAFIERMTGR